MKKHEVNPFETAQVASEWIQAVENELGTVRDNDIYPRLKAFATSNPTRSILEIGSGQGVCSSKLGEHTGDYIGVEPSAPLRERALKLYGQSTNRMFIDGNAYELPIDDNSIDLAFSVGLWFHLADLALAAPEMARVLKPSGAFLIVTSNPESHSIWESMFFDYTKTGNLISGKVHTLSGALSKSNFYLHEMSGTCQALNSAGMTVTSVEHFGEVPEYPGKPLMCAINGHA